MLYNNNESHYGRISNLLWPAMIVSMANNFNTDLKSITMLIFMLYLLKLAYTYVLGVLALCHS